MNTIAKTLMRKNNIEVLTTNDIRWDEVKIDVVAMIPNANHFNKDSGFYSIPFQESETAITMTVSANKQETITLYKFALVFPLLHLAEMAETKGKEFVVGTTLDTKEILEPFVDLQVIGWTKKFTLNREKVNNVIEMIQLLTDRSDIELNDLGAVFRFSASYGTFIIKWNDQQQIFVISQITEESFFNHKEVARIHNAKALEEFLDSFDIIASIEKEYNRMLELRNKFKDPKELNFFYNHIFNLLPEKDLKNAIKHRIISTSLVEDKKLNYIDFGKIVLGLLEGNEDIHPLLDNKEKVKEAILTYVNNNRPNDRSTSESQPQYAKVVYL